MHANINNTDLPVRYLCTYVYVCAHVCVMKVEGNLGEKREKRTGYAGKDLEWGKNMTKVHDTFEQNIMTL